jgi:hypothetical protein
MAVIADEKTMMEASQLPNTADTESEERHVAHHVTDTEGSAAAGGTYFVKEQSTGVHDGLKLAKDGYTVLIPQPSDDSEDPLNWSWLRKHKVLIALLLPSLLTDWGMTWGTTLFEAQAVTWSMSVPDVARSFSGGFFLQGPGGVFAVPFVQRYGRQVIPRRSVVSSLTVSQLTSIVLVTSTGLHHGPDRDFRTFILLLYGIPNTSRFCRDFSPSNRSFCCT